MNTRFLLVAVRVWLTEILIAGVNYFILMRLVYEPRRGELAAHQIGMATRMVCIVALAYLLLRYAARYTTRDLIEAGLLWLGLTLVFEWGGSLLLRRPVDEILVGWHVTEGYMWPYVLLPKSAFHNRACSNEWMKTRLLPDGLWNLIAPLLPPEPPKPKGGRPRVNDRAALTGILFVLKTGCPWQALPKELGFGSGSTCWRRLRDWQRAGVWDRLHRLLLDRLGSRGRLDWSRASLDSASIPAKRGANRPARIRRTAADRARSITCWWTATASHLPRSSARPTGTTHACWSRCLMRWPPSRACGAVPASDRTSCTATRDMTSTAVEPPVGSGASRRASPVGAWNRARSSAGIAGWSSAPWPGCRGTAGSRSATTA
jgi:transposase